MDNLEHHGIKGMKWGVRKSRVSKSKSPNRIVREAKSMTREIGTAKHLKNLDSMTDAQIKTTVERLRLENDYQRLAPDNTLNPFRRKHTRIREDRNFDQYLDRAQLSTDELKVKVARLQLEDNLKQQVKNANKDKKKTANKIINTSADQFLKVAGDDFDASKNDTVNTLVRESLKYARKGKVLK